MPGDVLERIDFRPGNFGVEYGRATGGIVDIGLRSPKKQLSGVLQFDLLDGRFVLEGPISKRTRFLVAGRRSWVDAWIGPMLEKAGTGVTAAPVYYDGQLVLEHDLTEATTVRLAAFGSSDKLALVFNAPESTDPVTGFGSSTKFFRIQARSDTKLSSSMRWVNTLSWGRDLIRLDAGGRYVGYTTHDTSARSELRAKIADGVTVIGGLDLRHTRGDVDLFINPEPQAGEAPSPFFARPANAMSFTASMFRPAGYAAMELKPRKDVLLVPGVRADYTSDTGRWDLSPRFVGRWDLNAEFPRTTLKGGVGVYRQPPQPNQSVLPYGTPHLHSERAMHYGVGIEQQLTRSIELSVEGFYKQLDELVVVKSDVTRPSGTSYANTGSGRVFGGELLARWKNDGRFFGWISYTLSRSERRDAPDQPTHIFERDQTHIFTMLGSYRLGSGWELGARWRYVTGNPYTPFVGGVADLDAGAYAAIAGPPNSARSEAFHRLDVRIEKKWTVGSGSVSAYLDFQNVYNRKNPEGRSYNYNYSQNQPLAGLPLLPVIGLRGEL
jgi:hypothetical protein